MRSEIYKLCLLNDNQEVHVTKALKLPPLLATYRQIRSEAWQIWCYGNEFVVELMNYDTTLYQAFVPVIDSLESDGPWRSNMAIVLRGKPTWANLLGWCEAVYDGKLPAVRVDSNVSMSWSIVQAATNIAYEAQTLPWTAVLSQLEGFKIVVGTLLRNVVSMQW